MYIVNTSTKKFSEPASLDLGLLPAEARMDFQLTDGSKPVLAEGKRFTLSVENVAGTLYKTDNDTVSFRYLKFDEASSTATVTMTMDGAEVLSDTISITYEQSGGGGSFEQQQASWTESDSSSPSYIVGKPNLGAYALVTETGNKLSMTIDSDYVLSVSLLDKSNATLSTQTVDLPLESMVVNASYANGTLTLTLQNGNTVDVDVSALVSGLVPDTRTINGHALSADVTITASDLNLATVATSGSYSDLSNKPTIPEQKQADWDESDSSDVAYIAHKPTLFSGDYDDLTDKPDLSIYAESANLATVATSGSYNDLSNLPTIPPAQQQADWEESDSTSVQYIQGKPALSTVATTGDYSDLTGTPTIPDPQVQVDWECSDSSDVAYILNKPTIPVVEPQAQANWDESDSTDPSYIQGKPELATVATTGSYRDLSNLPEFSNDWLCFTANEANSTLRIEEVNSPTNTVSLEYSTDGSTWTPYTFTSGVGETITLETANTSKVYFRGDNNQISQNSTTTSNGTSLNANAKYRHFVMTGSIRASGNIMSLLSKDCSKTDFYGVNSSAFGALFYGCTALTTPPKLPAVLNAKASSANQVSSVYSCMFMGCTNLQYAPDLPSKLVANYWYNGMFSGCTSLTAMPRIDAQRLFWTSTSAPSWSSSFAYMFYGCTGLTDVYVPHVEYPSNTSGSQNSGMFSGCTGVSRIRYPYEFTYFPNTTSYPIQIAAYAYATFECLPSLDTLISSTGKRASFINAKYIVRHGCPKPCNLDSSITSLIVCVGDDVPIANVTGTLSITGTTFDAGKIGYAELVINLHTGATVTEGTNMTFVDIPEEGKRNNCIVKWVGGAAKLYVVSTEDLDESSSSN